MLLGIHARNMMQKYMKMFTPGICNTVYDMHN